MNVIKVNFNNAYVKKPNRLEPNVIAYKYIILAGGQPVKVFRLVILPKLEVEPFYTDFTFDIYFNDVLMGRINKNSYNENGSYILEFKDRSLFLSEYFVVKITGEYSNGSGFVQEVNDWVRRIYTTPYCSNDLVCSERTYVSDFINGTYIYGFYNSNTDKFYYDRNIIMNQSNEPEYVYSDEFNTAILAQALQGKIFVDIPTMNEYIWDSANETFVLQSNVGE